MRWKNVDNLNKTINIFMPAYNEEKIIVHNILKVYNHLETIKIKYNIDIKLSILNDGSTDNTKNLIDDLSKTINIEVKHAKTPSRRENLIKYMIDSNSKYVGFMDCDLATDISDLENLILNAPNYDIIVGNKYAASSYVSRSIDRIIVSIGFNKIMRILFNSKIRDHACGFKMFHRDSLKKIIKYTKIGNKDRKMFWDVEMFIYAQRLKMKILEIPIRWEAGEKSFITIKSELSMFKYILKMRYDLWMNGKQRY